MITKGCRLFFSFSLLYSWCKPDCLLSGSIWQRFVGSQRLLKVPSRICLLEDKLTVAQLVKLLLRVQT